MKTSVGSPEPSTVYAISTPSEAGTVASTLAGAAGWAGSACGSGALAQAKAVSRAARRKTWRFMIVLSFRGPNEASGGQWAAASVSVPRGPNQATVTSGQR